MQPVVAPARPAHVEAGEEARRGADRITGQEEQAGGDQALEQQAPVLDEGGDEHLGRREVGRPQQVRLDGGQLPHNEPGPAEGEPWQAVDQGPGGRRRRARQGGGQPGDQARQQERDGPRQRGHGRRARPGGVGHEQDDGEVDEPQGDGRRAPDAQRPRLASGPGRPGPGGAGVDGRAHRVMPRSAKTAFASSAAVTSARMKPVPLKSSMPGSMAARKSTAEALHP